MATAIPKFKTGDTLTRDLRITDVINRSEKQILEVANKTESHYQEIEVPKKSGGSRVIHCPSSQIKDLHRCLLANLYKGLKVSKHAHGGVPGRSTLTCAKLHVGQLYLSTHDIKDFFPSVHRGMVYQIFCNLGFQPRVSDTLADLTTVNNLLPQGAPTSPLVANLALSNVDRSIARYCRRKRGITYTRYLDDIALSGSFIEPNIKATIKATLLRSGFCLSESKSTYSGPDSAHEVLGFTVNTVLRPTASYIRQLESDIMLSINHGISLFAAKECISMRKAKGRLNGRVQYLESHDVKQSTRLRGLLNEVDWTN